jgi:hypothetical protein
MATVVAACNIPGGITVRCYKMVDGFENTPMGARPIKKAQGIGNPLTLKGPARFLQQQRQDMPLQFGYCLTYLQGERADYFLEWTKQQRGAEGHHEFEGGLLSSHAVIWGRNAEEVGQQAARLTKKGTKSGFEPIHAEKNMPPGITGRIKVETDDDMQGRSFYVEQDKRTRTPIAFVDPKTNTVTYADDKKPTRTTRISRNGDA